MRFYKLINTTTILYATSNLLPILTSKSTTTTKTNIHSQIYLTWLSKMCIGVDLEQDNTLPEKASNYTYSPDRKNDHHNFQDFTPYVCTDLDEPETRESMIFNFNGTQIKTDRELCLGTRNSNSMHVVAKECTGKSDQTWSIKDNGVVTHPFFKRILAVASGQERLFLVNRAEIDTDEHILVRSKVQYVLRFLSGFEVWSFLRFLEWLFWQQESIFQNCFH